MKKAMLLLTLLLAGCGGLSAPEQSELPAYEVDSIEQTEGRAEYATASAQIIVSSDATDPLQSIADRVLLDNPDYDILNASFYLDSTSGEFVGGRNSFTSSRAEEAFNSDAGSQALDGVCESWDEDVLGPPPPEC